MSPLCAIMKKNYLLKLKKGEEQTSLPKGSLGKPLMLGDLDERVQCYISNARLNGAAVCSKMVMAAVGPVTTQTHGICPEKTHERCQTSTKGF